MIDSRYHVSINSVLYKLAQNAEGEHYILNGEPIRSPNAQVVTGDANATFQSRQDQLVWKITDWSAGEGQRKFSQREPNRHYQLENVDPFSEPGNLFLGPNWEVCNYQDATALAAELSMAKALGGLAGVNTSQDRSTDGDGYLWDQAGNPSEFELAENAVAGADRPAARGGTAGDELNLWYIEDTTDEVYRYTSAAWSLLNDQTSATGDSPMVALGDYLYIYDLANHKVYEISGTVANTATPETPILDLSGQGGATINNGIGQIFTGSNRVYVMQVLSDETVLWEVHPTSAAGPGYAVDVARFEGFKAEAGWMHVGVVYLVGSDRGATVEVRSIMYWIPGQSYGTLGTIRKERGVTGGSNAALGEQASTLLTSAFALAAHNAYDTIGDSHLSLWLIDAVSGGFCQLSSLHGDWTGGGSEAKVGSIVEWEGEYFVSLLSSDGTTEVVMKTIKNEYIDSTSGVATSPSYDFNLSDEKILESIIVEHDPLPALTTIVIEYSLDGGSWATAGTSSTDGASTKEILISDDTTPKLFSSIRLRARLTTSDSTVTPVLREIQVRASVKQNTRRWQLLLDIADDHSSGQKSESGYDKITNIKALGDAKTVVEFLDGYSNRRPHFFEQTAVRVDSYRIVLSRPGEGVAIVDLVEVAGTTPTLHEGVTAE